jgi:hypothetical protein
MDKINGDVTMLSARQDAGPSWHAPYRRMGLARRGEGYWVPDGSVILNRCTLRAHGAVPACNAPSRHRRNFDPTLIAQFCLRVFPTALSLELAMVQGLTYAQMVCASAWCNPKWGIAPYSAESIAGAHI